MSIDGVFNLSASPQQAHTFFQDFQKNVRGKIVFSDPARNFFRIFGNSIFLSRFIIVHPDTLTHYISSPYQNKEKPLSVFQEKIAKVEMQKKKWPAFIQALKEYKYNEYIRLTVKELNGCDQNTTYREFSYLAQAIITVLTNRLHAQYAKKFHLKAQQVADFALIAMGKLGGTELNYSSDVDLIGVYNRDEPLAKTTSHEFFEKLFAEVGKTLSEPDHNGFLYRVDWDLRPEGISGPLANSLKAMENYYETFGQEWERQAFIKARILNGDTTCAKQIETLIEPFVYRKSFDEQTIKNVWDMKSKIIAQLKKERARGINIKLDEGGIRDIEFFVQGFQLLYGGKHESLRGQNTIKTIEALQALDLITAETKDLLTKSYLFLRKIESCLQMEEERQTHVLRDDNHFKLKIARRLGITLPEKDAVGFLDEQITDVRFAVKKIFHEVYHIK